MRGGAYVAVTLLLGVIIVGLFAVDFPVLYQQLYHEAAQAGIERIQYTWDGEETYRQGAFSGNAVYGGGYDRRRTVVRHCIRQADDDAFVPHDRI